MYPSCHFKVVFPLMGWFHQWDGFYTMITYIIFDFIKDILQPILQVLNLAMLISQKLNTMDTN